MMISEFYQAGGREVDNDTFEVIQDVWSAYNRFEFKQDVAKFYNKNGVEGIKALQEPLIRYRACKRGKDALQEQINALLEQVKALQDKQEILDAKMKSIALQCDLSMHWTKWS